MSAQLADRRRARTAPDVHATVRDQLLNIEAGAEQMLSLIDDLLDVAHLRAEHTLQLRRAPTRLLGIVEQAVSRQQPTSRRYTLQVVADADPSGVWDGPRIGRVLDNLLSNAIKYSPKGGDVRVEVSVEHDRVGEGWAVLRVRDHGIGIPAQDVDRIFSQFFRARNVGAIAGQASAWRARARSSSSTVAD